MSRFSNERITYGVRKLLLAWREAPRSQEFVYLSLDFLSKRLLRFGVLPDKVDKRKRT